MKKQLIFIKFGGSVITDVNKPNTTRLGSIRRLVSEIKKASNGNL